MGANLIVSIYRGPKQNKPSEFLAAEKRLTQLSKFASAIAVAHEDEQDDLEDKLLIEIGVSGDEIEDGFETVENFLSNFDNKMSCRKLMDEIRSTLGCDFRDTSYRDFDDYRIWVVGDQTWGDEPDGGGFQTFKLIFALGLAHFFGLE